MEQHPAAARNAFLQYLADQERQVLLSALEKFDYVEMDAVLESDSK